ncbi:hypothetical protein BX616_001595 [Lobosporangium transversale]|nr:hypothetical protein BX616_001595 [Lobosporangium transversale]
MDHFTLESQVALPGPSQPIPVVVYKHIHTSMRLVFVDIPGPQATATIIVPTIVKDSRGLPHTLEHLVFCGSKNYPNRGYLDSLANRCLSTGTNAYTTEDYTGYTIATAGRDGMAEILPVFLDHVLHPTLRDDQYVTEVYHIDGEGKQQGVVFSEMAARENSEADLLDLGLRRLLYPKSQTYYYECGGLTAEIPKMTNDDIREYHKKFYNPSNMIIVVAGDGLQPERIFTTLIQQRILSDGTSTGIDGDNIVNFDIIQEMDISRGREDAPIMMIQNQEQDQDQGSKKEKRLVSRTIHFPSADEDVGSIGYGWLGPGTSDLHSMVALDILFRFLHETSASPFAQAFVERRNPMASHVDFDVKGCIDSSLLLLFSGVPIRRKDNSQINQRSESPNSGNYNNTDTEESSSDIEQDDDEDQLDDDDDDKDSNEEGNVGSEDEYGSEDDRDDNDNQHNEVNDSGDDLQAEAQDLYEPGYFHSQVMHVLQDFVDHGLMSDPTEMSRIIARHRTKIYESIEDDPHEAATAYLVPDILAYAYLEKDKTKPAAIGTRGSIFAIIDELETKEPSFWRNLAKKWLLDPAMVEVCMVPDSKLGKTIKSMVSKTQNELMNLLGEEGLRKQGQMVVEAVEANKVNLTPEIIAKMPPISDASKVPTIPIRSRYEPTGIESKDDARPFKLVQVVETNTFFTHVKLCLPLTHLDEDLRPYLVLFQELIFQSSCTMPKCLVNDDGSKEIVFEPLDYQSVVTLVSNTFVSHEAAVGFGNDIFACSWLSELFVFACSAERSKFKEQCELLLQVLMFTQFTEDRVLTVAKNLITQIMELKRDGGDMLAMVSTRMTTPVRGYETATAYCKTLHTPIGLTQARLRYPAHLESVTPVLGNDMAISIFRQEPFLKKLVQEMKQRTDQVPKIIQKLECIKQALLQSMSEIMMNSTRNGNTPVVGFAQIGVPIGFSGHGASGTSGDSSGTKDPVRMLTDIWDRTYELYQATSGSSLRNNGAIISSESLKSSKKRKPSEPFHQQQEQPSVRILKDEVETTIKTSHLTLKEDGLNNTNKFIINNNNETRASNIVDAAVASNKTGSFVPGSIGLHPFPFPRTPYRPLVTAAHADDDHDMQQDSSHSSSVSRSGPAPNSVLIPLKSITSSYLVSIVPCDIVYDPTTASEETIMDQYATLLLCEVLSRSEGPLYSAIRGQGYAYGCSISVYLWTAQMAFEVRDAMDPIKAYDAFLDIIRRMDTDWEQVVGTVFEMETAMASQAYQTCMERATAGGALSWVLRGAIRGYTSLEELSMSGNYLYKVSALDLKRVYRKYFKQFLNGHEG